MIMTKYTDISVERKATRHMSSQVVANINKGRQVMMEMVMMPRVLEVL